MTAELAIVTDPDDIAALPVEQRGQMITKALEESKSWLAVATRGTDPTPIAEFKAWAATVAEMTRQKGLAEGIQLDALEMVRRAERGIGVAIRNGQEAGAVAVPGQSGGPRRDYVRNGQVVRAPADPVQQEKRISPSTFFGGGADMSETYAMTDGVSDEQFESVLDEARDERNLSRRNVARKAQGLSGGPLTRLQKADKIREMAAQGFSSRQMAAPLATSDFTIREIARAHGIDITADRVIARTRQIDPERVVQETVNTLQGIEYGINLLAQADYDSFTSEQVRAWLGALDRPAHAIRTMIKELNRRV